MSRSIRWGLLSCVLTAFVGAAGHAHAQGVAVNAATEEQKLGASEAFQNAKEAFNERRLDAALEGFKASYDLVASPNAQLMVAVTLVELGRKAEAYELLDDVVRLAEVAAAHDPKYKNAATAARDKQAPLRTEIGLVTVVGAAALAQPGATLSINGRTIAPERWSTPIAVAPGPVSVALSGEQTRETTVVAGGQVTVDLGQAAGGPSAPPDDLADSDAPFDRMMVVYISGGVGAAGLLSFAIFGGIALGKFNSLDNDCPNRQCSIDRQGDADSGATFQAVANVSLGVGIVATCVAGAFLTWELLDDGGDEGDASEASPQATLGFGPGSLMVNGTF